MRRRVGDEDADFCSIRPVTQVEHLVECVCNALRAISPTLCRVLHQRALHLVDIISEGQHLRLEARVLGRVIAICDKGCPHGGVLFGNDLPSDSLDAGLRLVQVRPHRTSTVECEDEVELSTSAWTSSISLGLAFRFAVGLAIENSSSHLV